jgi:triosephosphate isomerase
MKKDTRKVVIAGNWKMNMTPSAAVSAIRETAALNAGKDGCEIVLCVPFVDLIPAVEAAKGTNVKIGAQNVHFEEKGAFTGEISASMLLEAGAEYVIVGHSERRQYFGETDETVNKRTRAALNAGLKVILCLGEVLGERQSGITAEIVSMQTKLDLAGIPAEQMKNVIIAYEPVWAIGTGLTATPDQAEEVCALIRKVVAGLYDCETAEALTIQYGGSMNDANAAELLSKLDVDGGLIGGASLVPAKFSKIVDAAQA